MYWIIFFVFSIAIPAVIGWQCASRCKGLFEALLWCIPLCFGSGAIGAIINNLLAAQ